MFVTLQNNVIINTDHIIAIEPLRGNGKYQILFNGLGNKLTPISADELAFIRLHLGDNIVDFLPVEIYEPQPRDIIRPATPDDYNTNAFNSHNTIPSASDIAARELSLKSRLATFLRDSATGWTGLYLANVFSVDPATIASALKELDNEHLIHITLGEHSDILYSYIANKGQPQSW